MLTVQNRASRVHRCANSLVRGAVQTLMHFDPAWF
jgi:hypothetical protein